MLGLTRLAIAIGLLVLLVFGIITLFKTIAAPSLDAKGPKDGALLGPTALAKLRFSAKGSAADLDHQKWSLDGNPVRPRAGKTLIVYRPRKLKDGKHTFEIVATGGFLGASSTKSWTFTVDTKAPKLTLAQPVISYESKPAVAKGTVNEDAVLKANRRRIPVKDGNWEISYAVPPATVLLTATDNVGNSSRWRMPVTVVPREPKEPLRAVHMSADAWANSDLRNGVLQMIDEGLINAVELDLKDESGIIGWSAPGLNRYGAVRETYDLKDAVQQLHAKGVRVIGRLVAFRDPIAAEAAWNAGRRDEVIQTPDGSMYTSAYGGFSNFANPKVRQYNIAIAVAAAKLGVDDILYDYIRRPDGPLDTMNFPGLKVPAERSIASFAGQTRRALRPYKTFLGASVFGIAATHPEDVAQDIPMMARDLDYLSPMVYPSHWGPGEYDVDSPINQPYDIVFRSIQDFERLAKGTGSRVVPWLQDFSIDGVDYGSDQVCAQIRAARDAGANEFLLWDPEVTYTTGGMCATAKMPATGTAKAPRLPKDAPGLQFLGSTTPAVVQLSGPVGPSPAGPAPANELGQIPVLMHHQISNDESNVYDLSANEFRAELQRLWKDGFVPINASALVDAKIDIPDDRRPVVMTFDDGTKSQFALLPDGNVDPDTAVGIMLAFAQKHPDFKPAGTFYVNQDPFELGSNLSTGLRWLTTHGFEIGNHTTSHADLSSLDSTGVQKELATNARMITDALPGYKIRTMALPFGINPSPSSLAVSGSYGGTSYGPYGVMLVGANPSASPFSGDFDSAAIPRIRSSHLPWSNKQDYEWDYWQHVLETNPSSVYVSDGDPATISFPSSEEGSLSSRFKARAKPY
jgi:peptidoglycan/xylan/chitin deacetylase (PgdA/CDA1 family)